MKKEKEQDKIIGKWLTYPLIVSTVTVIMLSLPFGPCPQTSLFCRILGWIGVYALVFTLAAGAILILINIIYRLWRKYKRK